MKPAQFRPAQRPFLRAQKRRVVVLGKHGAALAKVNHNKAVKTANEMTGTIAAIRGEGITAVREIAEALNARGVATPQGKNWHSTSVYRLLKRMERHA
jgi:hypothetical protein